MANYITLAEAKAWLSISDSANDTEITGLIVAASDQLVSVMEQDITLLQTTEDVDGLGGRFLFPRRQNLVSVLSAVLVDTGRAVTVTKRGEMIYGVTESFEAGVPVTITYTAGYATIPEPVKLATKMQVQALASVPAFNLNLAGQNIPGVESGVFHAAGPGGVRESVRALLKPYIRRFVIA
jgi:hypothetical protein